MNIEEFFKFDAPNGEFELLENEKGEPTFFAESDEYKNKSSSFEKNDAADTLVKNKERLQREFHTDINPDIIMRDFKIGGEWDAMLVFINGMSDNTSVNEFVLRDSMQTESLTDYKGESRADFCMENIFSLGETEKEFNWSQIKKGLLDGKSAVFIENECCAVMLDTRGYEKRTIMPPQNEKVVRGPHEGFTENLRTNITLLRRIVRTEDLVCEFKKSGGENALTVAVVYRVGVANASLVEEVKRRIAEIDTRMIIADGMLEQLTEKDSFSIFPQTLSTERPDRTASALMQGHVVMLLDGSPFASIVPTTLFALMTSAEDAYLRQPQGSVIRIIRFLGAVLSVTVPGIILALSTFHQGLLSTEMLATLITSRVMVFAPMGLEMIFLLLVFQLIREAGLRVAGGISQAVGIIGGLILGQAAVSANLVSSVVLIIVALTGLGNFCIPDYSTQIGAVYMRLALVAAAWIGGLLGFTSVLVVLAAIMAHSKSFGVPFLSPFAPKTVSKQPMIRRGKLTMHKRASDYLNTEEEK